MPSCSATGGSRGRTSCGRVADVASRFRVRVETAAARLERAAPDKVAWLPTERGGMGATTGCGSMIARDGPGSVCTVRRIIPRSAMAEPTASSPRAARFCKMPAGNCCSAGRRLAVRDRDGAPSTTDSSSRCISTASRPCVRCWRMRSRAGPPRRKMRRPGPVPGPQPEPRLLAWTCLPGIPWSEA